MSTRAERFKAKTERSGPPRAKKVIQPKRGQAAEGTASTSAHEKRGVGHTAERNESHHAEKKATFALDDSATTPSRKSTRKSANHSKNESNLRLREVRTARSAETRAEKATVPSEKPTANKIPRKR